MDRLTSWRTTTLGFGLLAFLAWAVHLKPELLDHPETLAGVALGVAGVLMRDGAKE